MLRNLKIKLLMTLDHFFYARKLFNPPPKLTIKNNSDISLHGVGNYKPVIIHFPGKYFSWIRKNIDLVDSNYRFNIKPNSSIHILQINNYSNTDKYENPGEYFLNKNQVPYSTLGKNISRDKWKNSIKIELLYNLLREIKITDPRKKYFLFFDSADAILLQSPEILIQSLLEYKCEILFGMDKAMYNGSSFYNNLFSLPGYMAKYYYDNYRFLNSGLVFGKIDTMLTVLNDIITDFKHIKPNLRKKSDQYYFHEIRFKYYETIGIDYKRKYFLNVLPHKSPFEHYQCQVS